MQVRSYGQASYEEDDIDAEVREGHSQRDLGREPLQHASRCAGTYRLRTTPVLPRVRVRGRNTAWRYFSSFRHGVFGLGLHALPTEAFVLELALPAEEVQERRVYSTPSEAAQGAWGLCEECDLEMPSMDWFPSLSSCCIHRIHAIHGQVDQWSDLLP